MSLKRSALASRLGALRAISARVGSLLASFLLTITVARLLDPTGSGVFFLILTSLAVLATFGRLGTDNLALKLTSGGGAAVRREVLRLFGICIAGGLAAFVISLLVVAVFRLSFPSLPFSIALIAASASIPQALAVLSGAILRGLGRLGAGTMAELGSIPILTLVIVLTTAAAGTATLTAAVAALTAASWMTAAWSVPAALGALRRTADRQGTVERTAGALPRFLRRNALSLFSMMGTSLLFYVLTWAPQYVLSATSGTSSVALYTVAARLAAFISLWPSIQVSYLAPAFARLYHHAEIESLSDLCNRAARQASAVSLLPVLVLTIGADPVLTILYGARYASAALPLILLAAAGFLVIPFGQVNQLMLLCGLEGRALSLNGVVLLAWATLGVLIGYGLGLTGVCAFALISSVAYSALSALLLRKVRGIRSFVRV
ncbi:hypothetical protein GCM10028798_14060 [Humibacter antri]